MNSDYVFLCGVMWCGYGQQEAGRELLRAALSRDPDISALAWAMFAKGKTALREKSVVGHPSKSREGPLRFDDLLEPAHT